MPPPDIALAPPAKEREAEQRAKAGKKEIDELKAKLAQTQEKLDKALKLLDEKNKETADALKKALDAEAAARKQAKAVAASERAKADERFIESVSERFPE